MGSSVPPADRADTEDAFRAVARTLFAHEHQEIDIILVAVGAGSITEGAGRAAIEAIVHAYRGGAYAESWRQAIDGLMRDAIERGAAPVEDAARFDFKVYSRAVQSAIDSRAEQLAGYVGETTAQQIMDVYHRVRAEGGNAQDLARAISQDVFDNDRILARALTIAATESAVGINTGAHLAAVQSGVIKTKTWRRDLNGDTQDPRDWHEAMDGETVALDEDFSNGLAYPADPGGPPEEVINCQCGAEYSTGYEPGDEEDDAVE